MLGWQYAIPFLAFLSAICLGGAALSGSIARRTALQSRLRGSKGEIDDKDDLGDKPPLNRILMRVGSMISSKSPSSNLRTKMAKAGYYGRSSVFVLLGVKTYLFLAALVIFSGLSVLSEASLSLRMLSIIGGATILFFVPNVFLQLRSQSRTTMVRSHLPDVIDLLEVCVSGGMGLDMAWNSVAEEIRGVCPLLADEMALTNTEIHLGAGRGPAMRNMAMRTGASEISALVAVLVQSEKFGTSIGEALQIFAKDMRVIRSQNAEESAEKMSVKMLFPMVVFIFPVVLIVAVGPAGITLFDVLGGY